MKKVNRVRQLEGDLGEGIRVALTYKTMFSQNSNFWNSKHFGSTKRIIQYLSSKTSSSLT